ncbi:hypothetical protein PL75_03260 [Neisseria arctica]|uniref:HeH/LEM domain-containing protein n=1 Tax=Neisseria arctica TaxID=1470200 RepID=A0A0J1C4L7_9NEIS|nr:HeH/LEM domain-containing protein [Neisseria arctica]KLT73258.1 hypothetical protein PL75_03260 [Neisseria arctica]UOO87488.1 HeH/LEM domain-containing protein [Neisseria arctica]
MGLAAFNRMRREQAEAKEREQAELQTELQPVPKTVEELKAALVELGVEVPDGAKKAELQALYADAMKKDESPEDGD